jgi:hypothetical protein
MLITLSRRISICQPVAEETSLAEDVFMNTKALRGNNFKSI